MANEGSYTMVDPVSDEGGDAKLTSDVLTENESEKIIEPIIQKDVSPKFGDPRRWFKDLNPKLVSLLFWEDPRRTAITVLASFIVLLAFSLFSLISVIAYASLSILFACVAFKGYSAVSHNFTKSDEVLTLSKLCDDSCLTITPENLQPYLEPVCKHISCCLSTGKKLFFIEDVFKSFKFALILYSLTWIGCCFNALTLCQIALVMLFFLPKAYEANQAKVDGVLDAATAQLHQALAQIMDAVGPKLNVVLDKLPPSIRSMLQPKSTKVD